MPTLLFEIGSEELPAFAVRAGIAQLPQLVRVEGAGVPAAGAEPVGDLVGAHDGRALVVVLDEGDRHRRRRRLELLARLGERRWDHGGHDLSSRRARMLSAILSMAGGRNRARLPAAGTTSGGGG